MCLGLRGGVGLQNGRRSKNDLFRADELTRFPDRRALSIVDSVTRSRSARPRPAERPSERLEPGDASTVAPGKRQTSGWEIRSDVPGVDRVLLPELAHGQDQDQRAGSHMRQGRATAQTPTAPSSHSSQIKNCPRASKPIPKMAAPTI